MTKWQATSSSWATWSSLREHCASTRRARRAAAQAAARAQGERERPSDEELGYFSSDDSFSKILSDAASGISDRVTEAQKEVRGSPVTKRFADLIDELGSKLTGETPDKR